MDDKEKLEQLVQDVQKLVEPAATLSVEENGSSGVLRVPFGTSKVIRDEYGRVLSLVGPGGTKTLIRNDQGAITGVYEEREEIIPD